MTRVEKKLKLSDEKFKRHIGTSKPVFQAMLAVLQAAYDKLHQSGGKPPTLTGNKLLITLKYYRKPLKIHSSRPLHNLRPLRLNPLYRKETQNTTPL